MKTAAMILILTVATLCGAVSSLRLKKRVDQLDALERDLTRASSEIRFFRNPFGETLFRFEPESRLLREMAALPAKSPESAYRAAKKKIGASQCLTESDWKILDRFFREEGAGNYEAEISCFSAAATALDQNKKEARNRWERYGRLYAAGGLMVGLFAVILLL